VSVSEVILIDKFQKIEKEKELDYSRLQPGICLEALREITEKTLFETPKLLNGEHEF
jgi:hypothetical protein